MRLIPVIDLKDGVVVHAQRGQRENYLPIHSLLSPSADVYDVIDAFLQLHDFKIIYLADLNAITGQGDNLALIHEVLQRYSRINFWLDSGYQSQTLYFGDLSNYQPVLGSECYDDKQTTLHKNCILSLDFSAQDEKLGMVSLFEQPELWSNQVIIMTLARVGSNMGPDIEKLRDYQQTHSQIELIASGGVRNKADLQALKAIGIETVLIASALHNRAISKTDIANL